MSEKSEGIVLTSRPLLPDPPPPTSASHPCVFETMLSTNVTCLHAADVITVIREQLKICSLLRLLTHPQDARAHSLYNSSDLARQRAVRCLRVKAPTASFLAWLCPPHNKRTSNMLLCVLLYLSGVGRVVQKVVTFVLPLNGYFTGYKTPL